MSRPEAAVVPGTLGVGRLSLLAEINTFIFNLCILQTEDTCLASCSDESRYFTEVESTIVITILTC